MSCARARACEGSRQRLFVVIELWRKAVQPSGASEDPLAGFIDKCLEPADADEPVTSSELHTAYDAWAESAGLPRMQRLNAKRFGRRFAERHGSLDWPIERTTVTSTPYSPRGATIRAAIELASDVEGLRLGAGYRLR